MVLSEGLFQLNATDPAAAAAVSPDGTPGTEGTAVVGGGAVAAGGGGVYDTLRIGFTASTATRQPRPVSMAPGASISVDLPIPGTPVTPTR